MNLLLLDALKKSLNDIENDFIIAEQTKDGMLYAKTLVKMYHLNFQVSSNCNTSFKLLEPYLSVGQMQEIMAYDASLRMPHGS